MSETGETAMSEQEAIERIQEHMRVHKIGEYPHIHIAEALNLAIAALESPRTDWTPCAEGLPEHCSENRVTVLDTRCGARYAANMDYNIHTKKWTNDKANELPSCYSVIAWQPLPAPYNPDHNANGEDGNANDK